MRRINRIFRILLLFAGICLSPHLDAAPAAPFRVRGMHIDLRTQVMTVRALESVIDKAADAGMNTLIMEWEATFPFDRHAVLRNRYAYTEREVRDLIAYARRRNIDIIPLQNCFGHCEYILRHERYAVLREDKREVSQVCPSRIGEAEAVFREIFAEIAAMHPSPYIHIGGDETRLLGHCKLCRQKVEEQGASALFVDYIKAMCRIVADLGKTPIIWGDMILQHPEAIDELPSNLIVADWNYGWEPKFFGDIDRLYRADITVWGASSLRSAPDNLYLTQWSKHLDNLAFYLPYARTNGFDGIIETSWSTSGQYGFSYDNAWEIVDMQPVREVYPLAGFDLLQQAFFAAVKSDTALDPKAFVDEYARNHFGFDAEGSRILSDYIFMPQQTVTGKNADEKTLAAAAAECRRIATELARLKPARHRTDFDHLRLMLDIRTNYLQFKLLERTYESAGFDAAQRSELAGRLQSLIGEGERLRRRFIDLNAGYLKNPAACFGTGSYFDKMNRIYQTLIHE